jgi:hypothetical protein
VSSLLFLGIALVVSVLGCLVLWVRYRKPRSMDAHIRDFARELDALAPEPRGVPQRRTAWTRQMRGRRSG